MFSVENYDKILIMYNSNLDKRIQIERLNTLINNLPSSLFTTTLASVFIFFVLYSHEASIGAIIWISSILTLTYLRLIHFFKLKHLKKKTRLKEEKIILFGIFLSGLLFGSSVLFIFPAESIALQALMFFLMSSMIAGSVALYSSHIFVFVLYSAPIFLSYLLRAYFMPEYSISLMIIGIVYYAVMLSTIFRVNHSIINSLQTQYLNKDLVNNLSFAKEELEKSNQELLDENSVRKDTEERLYNLANFDPLTGLANRHLFKENLQNSLKNAQENGSKVALLFLDLDNFKIINDTLGHAMGDKLLIAASRRLESLLSKNCSISRLGGDEFVIIINTVEEIETIKKLAKKIISMLEAPFNLNEHEMFIGTSIGISLYPTDSTQMDTLLSYADTAMYTAKDKGKNNYQFFTSKMYEKILFRHDIETKLHHAIQNNELRLEYQPKIDISTQTVIGAEALLRWEQKDLGYISPSVFIPIAEESSLINEVGKWVINKASEDIAQLRQDFKNSLCVSINISSSQILHQNLPQLIQENLQKNGIDAAALELEFTENMLIKQSRKSLHVLNALREMGIKLSIDDFGTGYSSLNYLKTLPIHTLKIDKSFICDTPACEGDCAIAKSIISLAHNLNLDVVAEGVETPEQLKFLKENGCSKIQGFYFSKPLDINAFAAYLNAPASKIEQALFS